MTFVGPLEFMEPDLSSLPPPRPMSPDPTEEKRQSLTEKNRQGKNRKKMHDIVK